MGGVCCQGRSRAPHRLTIPSQTVQGLTRQNMALNCTGLQASAYHTNSDHLSEYREAMRPPCLHFSRSFLLLLILTMKNQLSSLPFPPTTPLPHPPQPIKIALLTV